MYCNVMCFNAHCIPGEHKITVDVLEFNANSRNLICPQLVIQLALITTLSWIKISCHRCFT